MNRHLAVSPQVTGRLPENPGRLPHANLVRHFELNQSTKMTASQPKLRSDLELREQVSAQGRVTVIKDPVNGEFFRLQEAEQFIAQQLDGATPLETVRSRVEQKFGAPLELEALTEFTKTLDQNGLLESEESGPKRRSKRRRLSGNLLYLRLRLYDPQRLFDRLIHRVGFFFTPWFVVLSACVIGTAAAVAVFNWSTIVWEVAQLYTPSTLPLLIAVVFTLVTAHEFAHGLTCRHFGGEVRDMGFMLIYFQPALYCNVSDAWLFPKKSQRLWVGFAGPFFELFLWGLATMTWRVTESGTWINQISLLAMAVSGIKTLFNFNPLIKLDGYYLLSDWLDIPNLRRKSFRYLGDFLGSLGGLARPLPEVPRRERRIFLAYGLIAYGFSISLLTYVILTVGKFLIFEQQRMAFLLFTVAVGLRLRRRFGRLFPGKPKRKAAGPVTPPVPNGEPTDPATPGKATVPAKVSSRESKRRFAKLWRVLLKVAGATALVLLLFLGRTQLRVAGSVSVLPHDNADVRAEIDGIVEEIYVDEGQAVSKGDLIARLFDRDVRAEAQKIQAQMDEGRARLKLLEAGARLEETQLVQAAIATADEQLKFKSARLERDRQLYELKLLSLNEYQETARDVAALAGTLAEAKRKLDLLLAGNRPEEIEAMQASIASLDTQRRHLEEQLQLMRIVSPAAGIVTTPSRLLKEMKYRFVPKGELLAKVHDCQTITAEIAVSEREIADVHIGQMVALKARAYPNWLFAGKVTEIATAAQGATSASANPPKTGLSLSPSSDSGKYATTILVTTEIDNSAGLLKPGMTGMAKISCGELRLIDLITRRLERTVKVEFWSWW